MTINKFPYTCPRCGYETLAKSNMHRHFQRAKLCPSIQDIDLTDFIKEKVLMGRTYHHPKEDNTSHITNIQQVNCFMNIVNETLSPIDKIQKYVSYKDLTMITLDEELNATYANITYKLKKSYTNPSKEYRHELKMSDFHNTIDEISQSKDKDFNDFNIAYDTEINKISILDEDGEWKTSLEGQALQEIVYMIQDNYYDEYETYLIKKIKLSHAYDAQCAKELLREYYKFISVFDLEPFCTKDDSNFLPDILYGNNHIHDEFYPMYQDCKRTTKLQEKKTVQKTVLDIIKRNCAKNLKNLNATIRGLFSTDQQFKQYMIDNHNT